MINCVSIYCVYVLLVIGGIALVGCSRENNDQKKKSIGIHQVFSEVAKKSLTDKSCMVERQEVKRKCSANVHNDNYFGHYLQTVKEPGRCIKLFGGQKACVSAEYMDPVTTQCDDDVATSVQ